VISAHVKWRVEVELAVLWHDSVIDSKESWVRGNCSKPPLARMVL
jgi:hypothetical protein